jgi:hypothetical protein
MRKNKMKKVIRPAAAIFLFLTTKVVVGEKLKRPFLQMLSDSFHSFAAAGQLIE